MIFNKSFDIRIHFWLRCRKKRNRANRAQVYNLKIWVKETLLLSKARVVVTENILYPHSGYVKIDAYLLQFLPKYKKQATIAELNLEDVLILLPTALKKSWIYQVLCFTVSRDILPIGNKVPDWKFYWSADYKFYNRLEIWNCRSVWSTDKFVRKLILLRKNESFLERKKKTVLLKFFFLKRVEIQ